MTAQTPTTTPPAAAATTCRICGAPMEAGKQCPSCGAKPSLYAALSSRLAALVTNTPGPDEKRSPVLVSLLAIGGACVALGFELSRHALQAVLNDQGKPVIGNDGVPILQDVGAREEMVGFLVTVILSQLYTTGERVWRWFSSRKKSGELLLALFVGSAIAGGSGIGGCGSRQIVPSTDVQILHTTNPCRLTAIVDGEHVFDLDYDGDCPIEEMEREPPTLAPPAPDRDTLDAGGEDAS